ncbi:hypothetical protein M422DRAFT_257973 [Sphaerobolus stellatus SS14]|uniref:Uncharacterized protein n=1 Tax=Sphaerobolus stellatus (strain SS14) TaxID=990650 RepID=A0A0C9UWY2_SPHS4|nr:hypothetical protein M422DRAFT_257973 [Sphaerobolus stellatus SS14]
MTLLTVVTEGGRMTPGAALLSANVKKKTIKKWLKETKKKLMEHAKQIVKNLKSVKHKDPTIRAQIIKAVKQMVETGQWTVAKWMIDKCWPFLQVIKEIDPEFLIIICQFHIVTTLITFTGCVHTPEEVPAYKAQFYAHLEHACMAGEVVDASMSKDEFEEWIGNSKRRGEDYMDLVPAKGVIIYDGGGEEVMSVSSASTEAGNQTPSAVNTSLKTFKEQVKKIVPSPEKHKSCLPSQSSQKDKLLINERKGPDLDLPEAEDLIQLFNTLMTPNEVMSPRFISQPVTYPKTELKAKITINPILGSEVENLH